MGTTVPYGHYGHWLKNLLHLPDWLDAVVRHHDSVSWLQLEQLLDMTAVQTPVLSHIRQILSVPM